MTDQKNKIADIIRNGLPEGFTAVATTLADMLDRWMSFDSPRPYGTEAWGELVVVGKPLGRMSRDELLEALAAVYWAAVQKTKAETQLVGEWVSLPPGVGAYWAHDGGSVHVCDVVQGQDGLLIATEVGHFRPNQLPLWKWWSIPLAPPAGPL